MKKFSLFLASTAIVALHLAAASMATEQTNCPTGMKWDSDIKKGVKAPRGSFSG